MLMTKLNGQPDQIMANIDQDQSQTQAAQPPLPLDEDNTQNNNNKDVLIVSTPPSSNEKYHKMFLIYLTEL